MPTIRIDKEVYNWLKSQAIPFEDTPNSVLRRLAGLEKEKGVDNSSKVAEESQMNSIGVARHSQRPKRLDGRYFRDLWKVNVEQALYHQDGTWFENLTHFPGALFDFNGYAIFKTKEQYDNCSHLHIGQQLNVPEGISSIPGYKRMR